MATDAPAVDSDTEKLEALARSRMATSASAVDSDTEKLEDVARSRRDAAATTGQKTDQPVDDKPSRFGLDWAALRGVAPYAMGAGAGLMVGGPPGALVGAGAVGATDIAAGLYNPVAGRTGLPKMTSATEVANELLDKLGVPRARTGAERMVEAATGGGAAALSGAGAAGKIAGMVENPIVRNVLTSLGQSRVAQTISGALSGGAAQTAQEMGAGETGQLAAGVAGGVLPSMRTLAGTALRSTARFVPQAAAKTAIEAGYVLPPNMAVDAVSDQAGLTKGLSGWAGDTQLQQAASVKNAKITNSIARQDLGLPEDSALTQKDFLDLRAKAGAPYEAVKQAIKIVNPDATYLKNVKALRAANDELADRFPSSVTKEISDLADELANGPFTPSQGIEQIKRLRNRATANLKNTQDNDKIALGGAQREAADEMEDLIERNLVATGQTHLIDDLRASRQLIAKSHAVEAATNSATGQVDARHLGNLVARGKPLTGGIRTIADAANAFPKAMRDPKSFGGLSDYSRLDALQLAWAAAKGLKHAAVETAVIGRPLVRNQLLKPSYQKSMLEPAAPELPASVLYPPLAGLAAQQNQQQ